MRIVYYFTTWNSTGRDSSEKVPTLPEAILKARAALKAGKSGSAHAVITNEHERPLVHIGWKNGKLYTKNLEGGRALKREEKLKTGGKFFPTL